MIINVGWYDYFAGASLSAGSWTVDLDNVLDPAPKVRARSASALVTSTKFNATLDAVSPIQMVVIASTNLTSAALYRIRWWSNAFSAEVGNTGWLPIPGYPSYDYSERGVDICHIFASPMSYRWWTIEFDDTANPDGYVEVGRAMGLKLYEPPHNYDQNADSLVPNTLRTDALGGTGHFNRRPAARSLRVSWPALSVDEEDELREFREYNGIDKQVFVVPDVDDTTRYNRKNFLATMRAPPEFAFLEVDLMSVPMEFLEAV